MGDRRRPRLVLLIAFAMLACVGGRTGAVIIRSYRDDNSGVRTANTNVKLRVDSDPSLPSEPVLFVDYPAPTNDPAARDIHLETEARDWSSAKAIVFRIKPAHAMKISVSFIDRNRVVYTAWAELRGNEWQPVRIAFADIKPNPYFQPPGARTGAPLDVSDVGFIAFAPQDPASGSFAITQFALARN